VGKQIGDAVSVARGSARVTRSCQSVEKDIISINKNVKGKKRKKGCKISNKERA